VQSRRRNLTGIIAIVEGACVDCDQFDAAGEVCRKMNGCGGGRAARYRHTLVQRTAHCPLRYW
jgi:hypothetical protein